MDAEELSKETARSPSGTHRSLRSVPVGDPVEQLW
jgi:hypothetical protein